MKRESYCVYEVFRIGYELEYHVFEFDKESDEA